MTNWDLVFWVSLTLLLLTWVVYPTLMGLAAYFRPMDAPGVVRDLASESVDVVMATREVPSLVQRRVAGLRAADADVRFAQILVAVDRRASTPLAEYEAALGSSVQVVVGDAPGGKAAALNAGLRAASADLVVLLDSAQENAPRSIAALIGAMHQRVQCGAISGSVRQSSGDRLMDLYWAYELMIRRGQDALHSIVSTSGQLTIVRRALWLPMPADLICDDLFLTTQLVLRGHRVGFCEVAASIDNRIFTREQHFQRKARTLTGLYQFIALNPAVLIPWRNPIWMHFVAHKFMRFATPFFMAIVAGRVLAWAVLSHAREALDVALGAALVFAMIAAFRPRVAHRLLGQIMWAARIQLIPLVALLNGLRGNWLVWKAHRPENRAQQHG